MWVLYFFNSVIFFFTIKRSCAPHTYVWNALLNFQKTFFILILCSYIYIYTFNFSLANFF